MRPSCQFQFTPYRPNGCAGASNCTVTHGRATDARNTARGNKTDKERVCIPARRFPLKKNLAQIILALACNGKCDMEQLKEIALRGVSGGV